MHSLVVSICVLNLDGIVKHNGPIGEKNQMIKVFWDENISLGG